MTNAEIITAERIRLMEQGKLRSTGRQFRVIVVKNGEKEERTLDEPEELHTFQTWKQLGFSVKKGEKAITRFAIWKYAEQTKEDEDGEKTESRMFMKNACFFAEHQVERRAV